MTSPHQNPHQTQNNPMLSQSMSRFVAGSFAPERSDLQPPLMDAISRGHVHPNALSSDEPFICDLNMPEAQYERYKNLMKSNYYNLQANSTLVNPSVAMKYQLPSQVASYSQIMQQ